MTRRDDEATDPSLLRRIGDWSDHASWLQFTRRYDAEIRASCRSYRFDDDTTEELCQRIWIELAKRIQSYRYDPGKRFRGWLHRFCQSRAVDFLRQRQADRLQGFDAALLSGSTFAARDEDDEPDSDPGSTAAAERPLLLREAERVQDSVKGRVGERAWQAFWRIAVEGESIRETAESLGMSYAAAFAAQKRVRRMLREEGEQALNRIRRTDS